MRKGCRVWIDAGGRAVEMIEEDEIAEWKRSGAWNALWVTFRTLIGLLVTVGAYADAAVLAGACESARAGFQPFGSDADTLRAARERMRVELGDADLSKYTRHGMSLEEDDVVAYALDALERASRCTG